MKQFLKKRLIELYATLNAQLSKNNRAIIYEPWNIDTNCVDVANFIAGHYNMPVVYALPKLLIAHAKKLVKPNVEVVEQDGIHFKFLFFTSKYLFAAHWKFPKSYMGREPVTNQNGILHALRCWKYKEITGNHFQRKLD
jgi:hypothetical protein